MCSRYLWYTPIYFKAVVYISLPLVVIGVILNVVSVIVLGLDKTMKHTTSFLLQMLAVADCAVLASCLFSIIANEIITFTDWLPFADKWRYFYFAFALKYVLPFVDITLNAAVWLVVIVTGERYVAVRWPLEVPRYITMRRVRFTVGVTWFVSFALYVVIFFKREIISVREGNTFCYIGLPTLYFAQIDNYRTIVRSIMTFILPLFLLSFFNVRIINALRKSNAVRRELLGACGRPIDDVTMISNKRRCTKTLIVVVIVFIICQLPGCVNLAISSSRESSWNYLTWTQCLEYSNSISIISLSINSACNFVIYFLMGKRFRQILFSS